MAHPSWEDDARLFKSETLAYLKLHGRTIGAKNRDGDALCKRIMENYEMLYRSFDLMTHKLLRDDLATYEASRVA
jgi:hypothetical protein